LISVKAKIIEMGFNPEEIEGVSTTAFVRSVGAVALAAREEWVRLAQARLKSGREEYVNGLRKKESLVIRDVGETVVFEVGLIGKMPNHFEFGMDAFDMKTARPGWLGGKKAKTNKKGKKYVIIPFRHSTSSDARLAYTGKAKEADLKSELRGVVRDYGLNRAVKVASGGSYASGAVKRGPTFPLNAAIRKHFPTAKTHPLSGLTRIQKGGKSGAGQLMTFRVMSEDSAPGSWMHPGIKGANLLPEVEDFAHHELGNMLLNLIPLEK